MNRIILMNHSDWGIRDMQPSPGLPIEEPIFYWWIEKKLKRGTWKYVRDLHSTKEEAGELFVRLFSGGGYRLRRMASFQ